MKKIVALTLFILIHSTAFCIEPMYKTVLLISIDALHPDAVSPENCPNIHALALKGAYSPLALSSEPPKTLIAHTSMLTGLTPAMNGKTDNNWSDGNETVKADTIFRFAKNKGYKTYSIYSKKKLGYLNNGHVDSNIYAGDNAVEKAVSMLDKAQQQFIFLHISGLDYVGPEYGWMSGEYIEELTFIDEELGGLFKKALSGSSALVIVTSDHAGHEKIHGSDHPEDYKRPLIVYSSKEKIADIPEDALKIESLRGYAEALIK
ncbi:MAG: alkaline phosphatase family protein [Geovibrio sp.]|nr:alkaline phosphatase family protein [Geovibrio sp.]